MDYLPKTVLAIADSGCRTSVGGIHWHSRFQQELIKLGLEWEVIAEEEYFKFGAGAPEKSVRGYLYPVGVHGRESFLRMSEVSGSGLPRASEPL